MGLLQSGSFQFHVARSKEIALASVVVSVNRVAVDGRSRSVAIRPRRRDLYDVWDRRDMDRCMVEGWVMNPS